jgi:hypothetical protein
MNFTPLAGMLGAAEPEVKRLKSLLEATDMVSPQGAPLLSIDEKH